MAKVDNGAWDGGKAMSDAAKSDDPAASYAAICAGRRDGDPALQSTWALPHHSAPGDPPNVDGVHAALSRIGQAKGLINRDAAQAHLNAHMTQIQIAEGDRSASAEHDHVELDQEARHVELDLPSEGLQTLSVSGRTLGIRIVPYNVVAVHPRYGPLMFEPGAFGKVDPKSVRLRMDHEDPPTGLGTKFWEQPDGAWMEFQASKTSRGDDQLTLAADGVSRGASVGYEEIPGMVKQKRIGGQIVTVYPPDSARLAELSTTWMPTFPDAGVMYTLSKQRGDGQMAETHDAPVITPGIDYELLARTNAQAIAQVLDQQRDANTEGKVEKLLAKFDEMVELQRSQVTIPAAAKAKQPKLAHWVEMTLRRMGGQPMEEREVRELALEDVIISGSPGLVPAEFTRDYDDLISASHPFLSTTRQIAPPSTGTTMTLPIITQRAVAGTQAGGEKTALTTTATKIGTGTFSYQSVFGGADVSMQMILRADRSFFDLLTGDLAEAYALDEDTKALNALFAGYTDSASVNHDVHAGGTLSAEEPHFGQAFLNAITSGYRRAPDHIWMSAAAVAAFIDARSPMTNAPLYSNLEGNFTAGTGAGGRISGLIPVYVPALDSQVVDVIVGPSRGFVWAEDPARRLEADRPDVAGRDIALVGGLFAAPRYADAFTTYNTVTS